MRAIINHKHRPRRRVVVLVLLLALLLIPAAANAGGGGPWIYWNVIAAGGGSVQAPGKSIDCTIGQPSVGIYGGPAAELQAGFWNSLIGWTLNYLPIINKSGP